MFHLITILSMYYFKICHFKSGIGYVSINNIVLWLVCFVGRKSDTLSLTGYFQIFFFSALTTMRILLSETPDFKSSIAHLQKVTHLYPKTLLLTTCRVSYQYPHAFINKRKKMCGEKFVVHWKHYKKIILFLGKFNV